MTGSLPGMSDPLSLLADAEKALERLKVYAFPGYPSVAQEVSEALASLARFREDAAPIIEVARSLVVAWEQDDLRDSHFEALTVALLSAREAE